MRKHFCERVLAFFVPAEEEMLQFNGNFYLTATEAAKRLEVSDETIRRWVRLGRLPARKLGMQYFILEKDVEECAKAGEKAAGVKKGKLARVEVE